jgi:hypothetical protein
MHVFTRSKIARVRAVCRSSIEGRVQSAAIDGEVRPHTLVMLLEMQRRARRFFFVLVSEGFYGERGGGGGGGGALCAVRAREDLTEG